MAVVAHAAVGDEVHDAPVTLLKALQALVFNLDDAQRARNLRSRYCLPVARMSIIVFFSLSSSKNFLSLGSRERR